MSLHDHSHELTLGVSFILGAIHALEPGHGKTAMLFYLAGERRSLWHATLLAVSVAATHALSLFAIAFCVHLLQHAVSGDHHHEQVMSTILQWISVLMMIGIGLFILRGELLGHNSCGCAEHRKGKDCDTVPEVVQLSLPAEPGAQSPVPKTSTSLTMTALLGVAVGLLPCPSALAAYFAGLSTGSYVTAYLIIILFSLGIASTLFVLGIALQVFGSRLRKTMGAWPVPWSTVRASAVLLVGIFYLVMLITRQGHAG